jgi:hypothetical protein
MSQEAEFVDPRQFGLFRAAYTVKATEELLSISHPGLYELIKRGLIKPGKFGKKTLIYATDIAFVLQKMRDDPKFVRDRTKSTVASTERLLKSRELPKAVRKAKRLAEANEILEAAGL